MARQTLQGAERRIWELPNPPECSLVMPDGSARLAESAEELVESLNHFAKQHGYAVVRHHANTPIADPNNPGKFINTRYTIRCDRGGHQRVSRGHGLRSVASRKTGCLWRGTAKASAKDNYKWSWKLSSEPHERVHNHPPSFDPSAHPSHRRWSSQQKEMVADLTKLNTRPREVLKRLQQVYPQSVFTIQDVYNERARIRRGDKGCTTPPQLPVRAASDAATPVPNDKPQASAYNGRSAIEKSSTLHESESAAIRPRKRSISEDDASFSKVSDLSKKKTMPRTDDVSSDYILGTTFAGGGFGMVCEATHRSMDNSEKIYACKRLLLAKINITKINQEVALIRKSRHHHVVSVIDAFADNEWYNIILEPRAECNLGDYLQAMEQRFFDFRNWQDLQWEVFETKASRLLRWMYCLASTVQHIHGLCIRHRDIKPENILIHRENILFTDFGTSFYCEENTRYATTNTPGTAKYLPVEAADCQRFGRSGDIFSLGCVFFEISEALLNPLLVVKLPCCKGNYYSTLVGRPDFWNAVHQARWHPRNKRRRWKHLEFSECFPTMVLQLSEKMLNVEPTCRPTAKEVVNSLTRVLEEAQSPTPPCCTPLYGVLDA